MTTLLSHPNVRVVIEVSTGSYGGGGVGAIYDVDLYDDAPDAVYGGGERYWERITCDVRQSETRRGRSDAEARYGVGTATIQLQNFAGTYDLSNLLTDTLRLGRYVRLSFQVGGGATTPIYTGQIITAAQTVDLDGGSVVSLSLADPMSYLSAYDFPARPSQGQGEAAGARIGRVLDLVAWPDDERALDAGDASLQGTTLAQNVLAEIGLAADSDGGAFFADPAGNLTYRDRRWLDALPVSGYLTDSNPVPPPPADYRPDVPTIVSDTDYDHLVQGNWAGFNNTTYVGVGGPPAPSGPSTSVEFTYAAAALVQFGVAQDVYPAVEGDVVRVGAWIRHDDPSAQDVRIQAAFYDGGGGWLSAPGSTFVSQTAGEWGWHEVEAVAPAGTASVRLTCRVNGGAAGTAVYAAAPTITVNDDAALGGPVDPSPDYVPGEDGYHACPSGIDVDYSSTRVKNIVTMGAKSPSLEPPSMPYQWASAIESASFLYNYTTPNPAATIPLAGQIVHPTNEAGTLRVHTIDADAVDRSAALAAMAPGDGIAGGGVSWTVGTSTLVGDYYEFTVTPTTQAVAGLLSVTFFVAVSTLLPGRVLATDHGDGSQTWYVHREDATTFDQSNYWSALTPGGFILAERDSDPDSYVLGKVGSVEDSGDYYTIGILVWDSGGAGIAEGDAVRLQISYGSQTVERSDTASIAAYGPRSTGRTDLLCEDVADLQYLADRQLASLAPARVRCRSVSVDLNDPAHDDATVEWLATLDYGTRLTVGLDSRWTFDVVVHGVAHSIGEGLTWTVTVLVDDYIDHAQGVNQWQ